MNVLIFNGAIDDRPYATSNQLGAYLANGLKEKGFSPEIFNLGNANIPFFHGGSGAKTRSGGSNV